MGRKHKQKRKNGKRQAVLARNREYRQWVKSNPLTCNSCGGSRVTTVNPGQHEHLRCDQCGSHDCSRTTLAQEPPQSRRQVAMTATGLRLKGVRHPEQRDGFGAYTTRNEVLALLGFSSYADYLTSPAWKAIRALVLKRDRWTCWCCGSKATQVHHRHYSMANLTGRDLQSLVSVCRDCHEQCEFYEDGRKLTPRQASKRLRFLRKQKYKAQTARTA